MSEVLELKTPIHFKRSLKTHIHAENVLASILKMVVLIPNLSSLKLDIELTLHICKLIEALMFKSKEKIDKKQLLIDIIGTLFPDLTDDEKKIVESQVQFVFNNKMIKVAKSFFSRLFSFEKFLYKVVMQA